MKTYNTSKIFIISCILAVLSPIAQPVKADEVHLDDVIVVGSECVGLTCVQDMDFSFDTLVLSEDELRILFRDTSTTASFPTNDWRILINDLGLGGDSYFSIEDVDAGRRPFTIEAGATDNSLYVSSSGRVGIMTDSPTHTLHVNGDMFVSGNLEIGSSRELKEDIRSLDIDAALSALADLEPVQFHYKSSPDEESLGFIAEDVPELVATKSRKSLSTMDIVAVLTKVVQNQQEKISSLKTEVAELEEVMKKR